MKPYYILSYGCENKGLAAAKAYPFNGRGKVLEGVVKIAGKIGENKKIEHEYYVLQEIHRLASRPLKYMSESPCLPFCTRSGEAGFFMEGLAGNLSGDKQSTISEKAPVSIGALEALVELCSENILHLYLNPRNILFQRSENGVSVKIIDFAHACKLPISYPQDEASQIVLRDNLSKSLSGNVRHLPAKEINSLRESVDKIVNPQNYNAFVRSMKKIQIFVMGTSLSSYLLSQGAFLFGGKVAHPPKGFREFLTSMTHPDPQKRANENEVHSFILSARN